MAADIDEMGDRVLLGDVEPRPFHLRTGGIGEQVTRCRRGKTCLANALRPGEQPGMVHAPTGEPRAELRDHLIMADQMRHSSPSSAASNRAVTISTEPDASIALTRSGSLAANPAKAAATRR